jgi:hypothetical protein
VLQDAIQTYLELLTDDLACACQERLDEQQRRRGLRFGDRLLCTVLRPRFLTAEQFRFLRQNLFHSAARRRQLQNEPDLKRLHHFPEFKPLLEPSSPSLEK